MAWLTDPLGPTCPETLTPEPPARTLPFWTERVELAPLPHRPPLPTNDTLQVPSNLAASAKAEPDRMTPALSASATTDVLSMGCVPLLCAGLPGFRNGWIRG